MANTRIERDPLGEFAVPAEAYYGIQTARALENFPISGLRAHPDLITATVLVKKAAARANVALGRLDARIGNAIIQAADEILAGKLRDQFVIDVYQAGAGTSHNMNANEVMANRATEILGGTRGKYIVSPNDHVNMAQSTNDTIPTAIRLGVLWRLDELLGVLDELAAALRAKAAEDSLRGAEPTDDAIREAAELAAQAAEPQADHRGSVDYKRNVVRVFCERGLRTAISAAQAGEM